MGAVLGVIGLGRIGAFHAQTLHELDGVDGLVVTDERPAVTEQVAARLGAKAVPDAAAALSAGLDGVVIAAATPVHAPLLLAAVDAGVPAFCEKPLAFTAAESRDVVARLSNSPVPVQIGYNRRFDPAMRACYDAVRSGELGRLTTVRSTTLDPAPPPAEYLAVSGGIFRDCSVHDFDVVNWIVGRDVVEVYATGSDYGEAMFTDCHDAASATTLLTFDDGTARRGLEHPLQRSRLRLPPRTARQHRQRRRRLGRRDRRCATSPPARRSRPDRHTSSSWTASPTPTAPNSQRSWRSRPVRPPLRAHLPRRSRWRGSPRPHAIAARAPAGADRGGADRMTV